jgi:sugar phosphate isomerase/epimerase
MAASRAGEGLHSFQHLDRERGTTVNKLGVHALVWEAGWGHDECARAVAKTAEVGYDFIEAPALDPSSIDVAFTRRQLEKNGITLRLEVVNRYESNVLNTASQAVEFCKRVGAANVKVHSTCII